MRKTYVVKGMGIIFTRIAVFVTILGIAFTMYKNPFRVLKALMKFEEFRVKIQGTKQKKIIKHGKRYFYGFYIPGWPSKAFNRCIANIFNSVFPYSVASGTAPGDRGLQWSYGLVTATFAITKKCPFHCKHCYAGKWTNQPDTLTYEDLEHIIHEYEGLGLSHLQLSGGEPLFRYDELIRLLKTGTGGIEFMLSTTGYGLTPERAQALQQAGLTGVIISLDHYKESEHNRFRGHDDAFGIALAGIKAAKQAGLLVTLSLCTTKEFLQQPENLEGYYDLAHHLGAGCVRILEPRRAGNFAGKNVELSDRDLETILAFHKRVNSAGKYSGYPLLNFAGVHQKHNGCLGAGIRFLDIDADGNVHPCPFYPVNVGNCLKEPAADIIRKMGTIACECKYKLME